MSKKDSSWPHHRVPIRTNGFPVPGTSGWEVHLDFQAVLVVGRETALRFAEVA